ncbi:DUF1007 family protein [Alphaproteobacteria bacterium]|nr:DUF1007 family protein [Alphaproteobacteria bacterium]
MNTFRQLFFALLTLFVTCFHQTAQAHPHEWIDIRTTVIFNDSGQIERLRNDWTLDEYSTAYTMESMTSRDQKSLDELAANIVSNLSEFSYLTKFEGGNDVSVKEGKAIEASIDGIRFRLLFDLVFTNPVDVQGRTFSYSSFDPEYYIEILHQEKGAQAVLENAPEGCSVSLEKASPDETQVAYAQSLDKNADASDDLGALFAEKVRVSCN